ncbi:hypothetical protein J2W42_000781 [Rhizobium tibeticum]|uniref:hypothetical protein n=1 Tax=Rhizobium tibeticum TaxID=501024 RepID=UPI0027878490|nr:hypothetical protein [Rhizobium tibeticum]MDP9807943.1 hypothetical protein [Rhizobium tibeticum]
MAAILLVAALDAGRFHWLAVPARAVLSGYVGVLAGIAVTGWAQAVNPFFEPGVRIQSDRHQRVIDMAPYRSCVTRVYRALFLFFVMELALGSFWKLEAARCRRCYSPWARSREDQLLRA